MVLGTPRHWRPSRDALVAGVRRGAAPVLDRLPRRLTMVLLPAVRRLRGFQMSTVAMRRVGDHLSAGSGVLVFGLGRDSSTWEKLNEDGRTAFLEDLSEWLELSRRLAPSREVHLISYATTVDTSDYTSVSDIPVPSLPPEISSRQWDVVVVDGPMGFAPDTPGRASSIALAARLVARGGVVLVDDFDRELERRISATVFGRGPDEVLDPSRPVGLYLM